MRVEEKGFVFPLGHRAVRVTVTERKMTPQQIGATPQGAIFGATAHLRQREFVVIKQPVKEYESLDQAYRFGGREMPFRRVRIDTLVTPNLVDTPVQRAANNPQLNLDEARKLPFPIKTQSGFFPFQLVGTDWDGVDRRFELPLVFVPLLGIGKLIEIKDAYAQIPRVADFDGQQVALANDTGGQRGRTTLTAQQIEFGADLEGDLNRANLPPSQPPFLPKVVSADVSVPAIDQFLGPAATGGVKIGFFDGYLRGDPNPGEVFAKLLTPVTLGMPPEKAGGLAAPKTVIDGLSRSLGPVAQAAKTAVAEFDPGAVFSAADANLLGGITLNGIIAAAIGGDFANQIPKLVRRQLPDAVEVVLDWKPALKQPAPTPLVWKADPTNPDSELSIRSVTRVALSDGAATATIDGKLTNFGINFAGVMGVTFAQLTFHAEPGKKTDVSADGVNVQFMGALQFVNTLREILPANGFSDPPSLQVGPTGVVAGYSLGVPSVGVGIFSIQNIGLSAALSIPFVSQPAGVRFAISERQKPFLVTVGIFGGGGFFSLAVSTKRVEQIEASIEFGGAISLNLGIASGGVYIMAGIYFKMTAADLTLTGFLRCGGYLEVLGIVSISIEFYLSLTYRSKTSGGGEVWGQASVTVSIKIAFFSKSVTLSVERRFAGAAGDPTFEDMVAPEEFAEYCAAFA